MTIDKATFEQMHRGNAMATELLAQGIESFSAALTGLETLLANRLSVIGENAHPQIASV